MALTFQVMIMSILGGKKDCRGPILGAVILTLVSEALGIKFPYYYTIILGTILILTVKYFPAGILGSLERLHLGRSNIAGGTSS